MYAADFTSILHGKLEFSIWGGGTMVDDIWSYKVKRFKVGADVIVGENPSKVKGCFYDEFCKDSTLSIPEHIRVRPLPVIGNMERQDRPAIHKMLQPGQHPLPGSGVVCGSQRTKVYIVHNISSFGENYSTKGDGDK